MRNIFINDSVLNKEKKIFYADIYITENKQGSKQTSEGMSTSHAMWIKSEVDIYIVDIKVDFWAIL